MVVTKHLSPEQGELLRRDLVNGATKFLETGSYIPEANDPSRYQPSSLIQTSPKLLIEGPRAAAQGETPKKGAAAPKSKRQSRPRERSSDSRFSVENIEEFISSNDELSEDERKKLLDVLKKRKDADD
jgi:hypothetical protein